MKTINHDICSSIGAGCSIEMYSITNCKEDKTKVIVKLTVLERFSVKDIEKAEALYEKCQHAFPKLSDIV